MDDGLGEVQTNGLKDGSTLGAVGVATPDVEPVSQNQHRLDIYVWTDTGKHLWHTVQQTTKQGSQ